MSLIILPHDFVAKWSIGVYHDYFTSTITMIHKATRIEASSGKLVKPPWSKELTAADVADLKAGIGEATKILGSLPRCIPSVVVTLFRQQELGIPRSLGTRAEIPERGCPVSVRTGPAHQTPWDLLATQLTGIKPGCRWHGNGLARVRCQACRHEFLLSFSCKNRGICPSCTTRRMSDEAAYLADIVLPEVRYRQSLTCQNSRSRTRRLNPRAVAA